MARLLSAFAPWGNGWRRPWTYAWSTQFHAKKSVNHANEARRTLRVEHLTTTPEDGPVMSWPIFQLVRREGCASGGIAKIQKDWVKSTAIRTPATMCAPRTP